MIACAPTYANPFASKELELSQETLFNINQVDVDDPQEKYLEIVELLKDYQIGTYVNDLNDIENGLLILSGLEGIDGIERKRAVFLAVSSFIGTVIEQNPNKNNLIKQIAHRETSSFAHHRNILPFHTDGCFEKIPPKFVGILMEEAPTLGGDTTLVNLRDVVSSMSRKDKSGTILSILKNEQPIQIHKTNVRSEKSEIIFNKIVDEELVRFRYDLMMAGANSIPDHLGRESLREAIVILDDVIKEAASSHGIQYTMEKDKMYFLNNHFMAHNRSAYEGQRVISRTWIQ